MKNFFTENSEVKVPVFLQKDALECGAVSLAMILAYYGKWIPVSEVRTACGVSRDGSSGKNILTAARNYGLEGKGKRVTSIDPAEIPLPCILHYNNNHFVVFCGYKKGCAVINDPARGRILVPMEEFERSFHGLLMMCTPGESFVKEGRKPNHNGYILRLIRTYKKEMLFMLFAGIVLTMISVIQPVFQQTFLDKVFPSKNVYLNGITSVVMLFLFICQTMVLATDILTKYRINRRVSFEAGESFFKHLLQLDMSFYSCHMTGDLVGRQKSNEAISQGLIQQLAPILQQFATIVLYVVIMISYNSLLAFIGIFMSILSLIVTIYVSTKQVDLAKTQAQAQARVKSYSSYGIRAIESIKSSGAENGFYGCWADMQAVYHNESIQMAYKSAWITTLPGFMELISSALIAVNAAWLIMQGHFTIGAFMAFETLLASFYSPVNELTQMFRQLQMMQAQIERVEDVLATPADPMENSDLEKSVCNLEGSLSVNHLTFGYGKLQPATIRDISFEVKEGQSIGIAGGSGCGKSTLLSLLLGLYQPWEGEISFGKTSIAQLSRTDMAKQIGIVRQEVTLFEGTVRDNLKMWDDSITDEEMIKASKLALIHDEIMMRSGGYDSPVTERGTNFSGGQRQKMELARALLRQPRILIMDEATSALDSVTEEMILGNLKSLGITSLIVAHRLSAIRSCNEIMVMKNGRIVQRGSHEQLMEEQGIYRRLVESDKNDRS